MYGFITGYHLRFFNSEPDEIGSGTEEPQVVVVTKDRDELFHRVSAGDIPRGSGEVLVEVSLC